MVTGMNPLIRMTRLLQKSQQGSHGEPFRFSLLDDLAVLDVAMFQDPSSTKHGKGAECWENVINLLNADLAKNEIYSKLDQKTVTSWFDLRNKAAHGKYDEYSKEQVSIMLQGIIEFMSRNSI